VVVRHCAALFASVTAAALLAGCSSLLSAEPTPVPGAAATLTRSVRTPIPTPERAPAASPAVSPVPSRVAGAPGPTASTDGRAIGEEEIAQLRRTMEQTMASPALPGVESVLLDHVALSTAQGGSVMDNSQAASWLRDHAGTGIRLLRLERGAQSLMLQVLTEGWPQKDPIEQGLVSFSLRRYDARGRPDEEGGVWKVDVINAE
jgi:hypothetical protein